MARYALLYPFKPGLADQADDLFRMGGDPPSDAGLARLVSTTVFRHGDLVVRVFEIEGDLDAAIEGLVKAAALFDVGRRLKPLLESAVDLTTEEGLREFFRGQMMTVVTHREASGVPEPIGDYTRHAITFSVRPGTEDQAAAILSSYESPDARVDDDTWLLNTTLFMKGNLIVRVMDIKGSLPKVMAHLSQQPGIRAAEEALDPILEIPRDMSTPDGARAFFMQAMMQQLTHRVTGQARPRGAPVFLITGATGGLGASVARRLLERGDRLVLTGRNKERLSELEAELAGVGGFVTFTADVTDPEQAAAAAAEGVRVYGQLDGLIHLVGSFHIGTPAIFAGPDLYREQWEANFLSAAVITSSVLRHLDAGGYLVYVSSLLAAQPMAATAPYAASKAALMAWMGAMSQEALGRGVHANAIETTIAHTSKNEAARPGADTSNWVAPDHLVDVIAFLSSPGAEGMFGAVVPVYGPLKLVNPLGGPPPGVVPR